MPPGDYIDTQRRILLSPPDVGEREGELLIEAFDSGWIAPVGPQLDTLETALRDQCGVGDAVALSSGTAGLHLALHLLGVGCGDEVGCSDLTFAASVNAVTYLGARPVLVDADAATWQLDPSLLAETLADRARTGRLPAAVLAVDLYGQCADYERIGAVCAEYEVPLVEDAAEALGATFRGQPAGSLGDIGVLSFNGNKIITTSGGGALLTDSTEWAQRARFLASQARDAAPHYEHSEVGYNYRLSNLLAGPGASEAFQALQVAVGLAAVDSRSELAAAGGGEVAQGADHMAVVLP
jgi:dTDP-4-amino-4,6-dideoxygalactose transaminase